MATLEERVAYLEGRSEEHGSAISELRLDVRDLRAEMNRRFDQVDRRFELLDSKFDAKFDLLDSKFDAKFTWMIGLQFATLLAFIGALLNGYFR